MGGRAVRRSIFDRIFEHFVMQAGAFVGAFGEKGEGDEQLLSAFCVREGGVFAGNSLTT